MTRPNGLERIWLVLLVGAVTAIASHAQTFNTLFNFDGTNGAFPLRGSLLQGADGSFYGTTVYGGSTACDPFPGCGTVFKIGAGSLLTVYDFCPQAGCADGEFPWAGLIQATNGNFYGTTTGGGANGWGTVFSITTGGTLTTLYSFCSQTNCADGAYPVGGLVQGVDGNFYGTTCGTLCNVGLGNTHGTVFKMTPGGTLTTLYTFCAQGSCSDGAYPNAALIQGSNGSFYGTTLNGGTGSGGLGTVFRLAPGGTVTTVHSFNSGDGSVPYGPLVQATNGNFYGTTSSGGTSGAGTVFKMTLGGTVTTLHSFNTTDGSLPYAGLVQGTDGNFYGTTARGGASGVGTAFKITAGGTFTTLHTFTGPDGSDLFGGLVQATDGTLYGTTYDGGTFGDGTVFNLGVGLGPFVKTLPGAGKVGKQIGILGTNLTGASSVKFNGTTAQFRVTSPSLILTKVPAGATTGTIKVTLPGQTLSSNVPFFVLK
jgi:uncharacterized repeat protein (TIGR03803 family)